MIRKSFEIALKKGEVGEQIARNILEGKGWVVYQPVTAGPHCFDMVAIKDKRSAIALDVKAKARMNYYPATGIDQKHFEEYQNFSNKHQMPFWLVFVDEMQKTVYGNSLDQLEKPLVIGKVQYPKRVGAQRIWPLCAMKHIATLDCDSVAKLLEYNQRTHAYTA